jgi:hypothetical protein
VLVSRDDGATWESLRLNMPTVAIADLVVAGDDLVIGSLGRSAWILDDLTPVREMNDTIAGSPAHLFPPSPAIRWHVLSKWRAPLGSRAGAGKNPPSGAVVTYWLAEKPEEPITLEILDAEGGRVRRLSSEIEPQYTAEDHPDWNPKTELKPALPTKPGLNRAAWDLGHERSRWVAGSRNDNGGRGPAPKVVPGEYTLRLTVAGEVHERKLRVEPDPRSTASAEQLQAQVEFGLDIRDRMSRIVEMVETLRSVREQIAAIASRVADDPGAARLVEMGEQVTSKLTAIEEVLHNPQAEVNYDVLAGRDGGAKLYSRLGWLASGALDHDGPPTQGMTEVAADLAREMAEQESALARLLSEDLASFNATAEEAGLALVGNSNY